MPWIPPLEESDAPEASRATADAHAATGGRMTNMKWTLAHDPAALDALLEWYPLHDRVVPILGERRTNLFCHAISVQNDCLICSTFFRRILIDSGEDPDALEMDAREAAVVAFGRALAQTPHRVPDAVYDPVAAYFGDEQMVALTAFGALMVATNVINNVLRVPLDDYLQPYRRQPAAAVAEGTGTNG